MQNINFVRRMIAYDDGFSVRKPRPDKIVRG